ncbi:MAG: 4-hydroxy-tetrahydrodipicolinate reductase [Elusimicrobia bacterium]|nr:4-hydroxy-tetrahydrodipicolinate reductase [Candidatus Liberimonas magnetica]
MDKIKIIVCGAAGRMGQRIISLAKDSKELEIAGAVETKGHPMIGKDEPKITSDLASIIKSCDVVMDFTAPISALINLETALENKKAIVIGTTGFNDAQVKKIKDTGSEIPVLLSPNMSIGVNLLFKLAGDAAKVVPDYDVEIVELHHNKKKDAPSGTAVKLFEIICNVLGKKPKDAGIYGRHGIVGERTKEEIGIHSIRAGDIVGEHTVYFAGPGERIELVHRALSRDTLANGALLAAKWIYGKKPGMYNMQDVLNIR